MGMTRLDAAPIILLQTTTKDLPRPPRKHAVNQDTNNYPAAMEPTQIMVNGHTFSRYECEIACAIQLYIRNASNQRPSDDTLGYIIKSLRGEVNGEPLPCQDMVFVIEHYEVEVVRAIYLSVYCNREHWKAEASRVWHAWLAQNDALVQRLKAEGCLAPFLNADGTLKTNE